MKNNPMQGKYRWAYGFFEPLAFHKRVGLWWGAGPDNVSEWYIGGHSEEMAKKLSELGVNLITTNFFKGYGLSNPQEDIERSKKFISYCHKYGIKALAYVQFRSIMPEIFLKEVPEAEDWPCRDPQGKIVTFGNANWRWQPCPNEPKFVDYIKKVIEKALTHAKADGIHLDNFYLQKHSCYCGRCGEKFRGYLGKKYSKDEAERLLGFSDFSRLKPPSEVTTWDAIYREWIWFKCNTMKEIMRELSRFIKSVNPDAIFAGHPSYGWNMNGDYLLEKSGGPELLNEYLDMCIIENLDFPRIAEDGTLITEIRGCKIGLTDGCVIIPFGFIPPADQPKYRTGGGITAVPKPRQVKLAIAEFAAFGGHAAGGMWVTAPYKNKYAFEDEEIGKSLKTYYDFLIENEGYYQDIKHASQVAVLRSSNSLAFTSEETGPCMGGIEQTLIQGHIPFEIIFDRHLSDLSNWAVLILPNLTCMTNDQIDKVKDFVRNGGNLVVVGDSSLYTENYRYREDYGLTEVTGVSFSQDDRPSFVKNSYGKGKCLYLSEKQFAPLKPQFWRGEPRSLLPQLPGNWERIAQEIKELAWDYSLDIWAPKYIALEFLKQEKSGRFLLHLLNYDSDNPVRNIDVKMNMNLLRGIHVRQVMCLSPGEMDKHLNFKVQGNYLFFTVGSLDVYDLVVISS